MLKEKESWSWIEVPAEYMIYGNEKIIQWAKRTLDVADNDVNEKILRCLRCLK